MRILLLLWITLACAVWAPQAATQEHTDQAQTRPDKPPELSARIDALATPLIDAELTVGMAVGTWKEGRIWTKGYGRVSLDDEAVPDAETVYEIGSITKVFTGILLALAADAGEVSLEDLPGKHLPEQVSFPIFEERPIRLVDLSTHASGLPRMPPDFAPADVRNPFADYDDESLYTTLNGLRLGRGPGDRYEYSNLAQGLLGHILCLKAKQDYESLVRTRITDGLGMNDTRVQFTDAMRARLAPAYQAGGHPSFNWDLDSLAGAGALRSTVADMLRFAAANLQPPESPLGEAMRLSHQAHFESEQGPVVGLGWHHDPTGEVVWHNGGTGGYHAFLAIRPSDQAAVVVLANTTSGQIDRLGNGILRLVCGEASTPMQVRQAVEVDRSILERYVGDFELAPEVDMMVRLGDRGLTAQITGQDTYPIFAVSETRFFWRVVEAEVEFEMDDEGRCQRAVLHQGGREMPAPRKSDD